MPPVKRVKKNEIVQVEPTTGFGLKLDNYGMWLKATAGIIAACIAIYSGLWSIGLAPMTNAKTAEIVEEKIQVHQIKVAQNLEKQFDQYDKRMKDVETSVKTLNDSASRVDERTRSIQEEQRSQRELSNKILMELQNRKTK